MTIQEIELAYDAGQALNFSRHDVQTFPLTLKSVFFPLGFPTEVRTNSKAAMAMVRALWGEFPQRFTTQPIRIEIHVTESLQADCPPVPSYRMSTPLVVSIADHQNYSIVDLERQQTQIVVSKGLLRFKRYFKYFFLDAAAYIHLATSHGTPIHSGCVALEGHGVLLCGDTGAGKSSLAYACGRAGFTYTADDSTFLLNDCDCRTVVGDCHRVRLRPESVKLFPEIADLKMLPRAAGKPSVELQTGTLPGFVVASSSKVDYLVFLNRTSGKQAQLRPYRKEVARLVLHQALYGLPEKVALQHRSIERLLEAKVFELHYTSLKWAVGRLRSLLLEGA